MRGLFLTNIPFYISYLFFLFKSKRILHIYLPCSSKHALPFFSRTESVNWRATRPENPILPLRSEILLRLLFLLPESGQKTMITTQLTSEHGAALFFEELK